MSLPCLTIQDQNFIDVDENDVLSRAYFYFNYLFMARTSSFLALPIYCIDLSFAFNVSA